MSDTVQSSGQAYGVGSMVRVTKQLSLGNGPSSFVIEGEVLRVRQSKTGSWYAHSRDKKLWLDRIELKKVDGEIVIVNLDDATVVEMIGE